ncbi:hypothetical protein [Polluticoccus soli]|uniref:hypothetical protein n=1 Tax=Polluticoccus soli TaxID=3034150 RepID=UPI0023E1CB4B|nr:hypothetical protein [Flavipsychrobacter sp. JY13-12]
MKLSLLPLVAITALIFSSSCDKKDDCVAGKGGDMSIVVFAVHNGDTLLNYAGHPDTAFVKYNTATSPGTNPSNFDSYVVSEAGEDHIHLEDLKCGDYFVYRTAFDSAANKVYTGSMAVILPENGTEKDIYINVN